MSNTVHLTMILLIALTLQIQSGKCCALGEFVTKLWSAIQVHYACTAEVVLVIRINNNIEFARSMQTAVQLMSRQQSYYTSLSYCV